MTVLNLKDAVLTNQFSIAGVTGATAASAATKILFYARWASTTQQALITKIEVTGHVATTAYSAGQVLYEAFIARGFSAVGAGGTSLTLTGAKLASPFSNTGFTAMKVNDTTAAGLTAGTWTLDANPVGNINTHTSAGTAAATPIIGSQYIGDGILFEADIAKGELPIILNANEGVVVRAAVPATGVGIHGIMMKWIETDRPIV